MASDPTGTHPLGVLTRHAADFFDDNMGLIGFQFQQFNPPPGLGYQSFGLYNNALGGVLLKVYGVTASNDGGGGLAFWFVKGTLGAFQNAASALRPDVGIPYGQIYFQNTNVAVGNPNPFIPAVINGIFGSSGFDSITTCSPFPLAIIPAGYSLACANIGSSFQTGVSFWYQLANE